MTERPIPDRARWRRLLQWRLVFGFMLVSQISLPSEPDVRIGIGRNLASLTVTSSEPFELEGNPVRSARFSSVIVLGAADGAVSRDALETRMVIDTGADELLLRAPDSRVRMRPGDAPLEFNGRRWRGDLEVVGDESGAFTLVNELPLEDYLLGVVPNELGPEVFPELEALKAQAIAARTYIVRNMGQFADQGFDICATDQCQVYFGLDTEHEMATEAVEGTRGQIATWQGSPINALYSSTCGGRTEDAANVFGEAVPYLVSVDCTDNHPEPHAFRTSTLYDSWEEGLLAIAGIGDFADAARFMGLEDAGNPASDDPESIASYVKERFFPDIPAASPAAFLEREGVLVRGGDNSSRAVILRLLDRKGAFEWQDARLISWDGELLRARVGQGIRDLVLDPAAAVFLEVGETRIPVSEGEWIGGERLRLRIRNESDDEAGSGGTDDRGNDEAAYEGERQIVDALVYEPLVGSPSADRYSPVAHWEVSLTREQLNDAVEPLDIGTLEDIVVLARGSSGRVVEVELRGTLGAVKLTGPRLRTLLGLRDSLVYIEESRNQRRELLGMTLFGGGWGHGVGMCQVGAFGMAMDGATAEDILKTYYTGIEIEKLY